LILLGHSKRPAGEAAFYDWSWKRWKYLIDLIALEDAGALISNSDE
jgi:hypothetical protein